MWNENVFFELSYRLLLMIFAITSGWGPYWAGDVFDVINLQTRPHFRYTNQNRKRGSVDWWRQEPHRLSTVLIDWLSPIMRKIYYNCSVSNLIFEIIIIHVESDPGTIMAIQGNGLWTRHYLEFILFACFVDLYKHVNCCVLTPLRLVS